MSNTLAIVNGIRALLDALRLSGHAFPITPHATEPLPEPVRVIYVGTGGDLAVIPADAPEDAQPVVYKDVPAGFELRLRVRAVVAPDTKAQDLIGQV